jgi:hypothetical protein
MPNLLYVTPGLIKKLHQHPAFRFWNPMMLNFPIHPVPLDERIFHQRQVKAEHGGFYLTTDMKFVYCSDKLLSFLYENQDLSFRLTVKNGILLTVDGKQFTSLLGKVAQVISSSDIELVNADKVFHPYFDEQGLLAGGATPAAKMKVDPPAIKRNPKPKKSADEIDMDNIADQNGEIILGKYERSFCEEMVHFRNSSKKSYSYLGEKYNLPVDDVKAIVTYFKKLEVAQNNHCDKKEINKIPKEIRDEIVRMKKVSKKSYKYLSERFKLSEDVIKDICIPHLKRPRRN